MSLGVFLDTLLRCLLSPRRRCQVRGGVQEPGLLGEDSTCLPPVQMSLEGVCLAKSAKVVCRWKEPYSGLCKGPEA